MPPGSFRLACDHPPYRQPPRLPRSIPRDAIASKASTTFGITQSPLAAPRPEIDLPASEIRDASNQAPPARRSKEPAVRDRSFFDIPGDEPIAGRSAEPLLIPFVIRISLCPSDFPLPVGLCYDFLIERNLVIGL